MSQTIRIAVCDDTPTERDTLYRLLSEYLDSTHLVAEINTFDSGEEFLKSDISLYDLIVLDVIMGELNGIETAKSLREKSSKAQIIFCSTSREWAADSYDVSALHYLIKPVSRERFFSALDFFFHAYQRCKTVTYKNNRLDETVFVSDILYIESGKNHKTVIHTSDSEIITRTSMSDLLSQIDSDSFISPIRYAAVNLDAVATVPSDVLILSDKTEIPISRDRRPAVKAAYTNHKMKSLLMKGAVHK